MKLFNKICVPAALTLAMAAAVSCSDNDDENAGWTELIKVATYNIQYDNQSVEAGKWDNRKDLMQKMLKDCDFDIFGVQEPYKFQIDDIVSWFPEYGWVGASISGESEAERVHYNPIFYRKDRFTVLDNGTFWYSETPDVVNSKGWDSYSVRMCNWVKFKDNRNGKIFFHFNSHFDHKGETARLESAKLLVSKVKEIAADYPSFCTGDYNTDQTSAPYQIIIMSDLMDSYSKAQYRSGDGVRSYNGYSQATATSSSSRIDHIFVSRGTKVYTWSLLCKSYDGKFASDHNPIVIQWSLHR